MNDIILQYDRELFLYLNGLHNSFFDFIMYWASEELTWVPIYAVLAYALYRKYGFKGLWFSGLVIVGVIAAADQSSVKLFKNVFMRYRPCHNLEIQDLVHLVHGHCGGKYGFVSSHAANTFALATVVGMLLRNNTILWVLWFWAFFVSYSRIYLGVHYPSDVIGGAMLGTFIGYIFYSFSYSFIPEKPRYMMD